MQLFTIIGSLALSRAYFGQGTGPIHLTDVLCKGTEDSVLDCDYTIARTCQHYEDAGVICQEAQCEEGDIRIADGDSESSGRVEICLYGVWGTVCDRSWGSTDARVVCRQLDLPTEGIMVLFLLYLCTIAKPSATH